MAALHSSFKSAAAAAPLLASTSQPLHQGKEQPASTQPLLNPSTKSPCCYKRLHNHLLRNLNDAAQPNEAGLAAVFTGSLPEPGTAAILTTAAAAGGGGGPSTVAASSLGMHQGQASTPLSNGLGTCCSSKHGTTAHNASTFSSSISSNIGQKASFLLPIPGRIMPQESNNPWECSQKSLVGIRGRPTAPSAAAAVASGLDHGSGNSLHLPALVGPGSSHQQGISVGVAARAKSSSPVLEGRGERGSTRLRGQQAKWEVKYHFQSPLEKKLQKQLEVSPIMLQEPVGFVLSCNGVYSSFLHC
jgi:hypothetical protein